MGLLHKTLLIIALLMLPLAFSAIDGAQVTVGTSERGSDANASNTTIIGGNVTSVNISGTPVTARWGGFFGTITGGFVLGDASGNKFFEWTVSDVTASIVYATNDTTSFGNVVAANASVMPSYVQLQTTDNWTNTFNWTGNFTNSSQIGLIEDVSYTYTFRNSSQDNATLRTFSLFDLDDKVYIMAGVAEDSAESFQDGGIVDYQIIVPASPSEQMYFFYLELP